MRKIKILIADDHQLIREGLEATLHNKPLFDVVGKCGNGLEVMSAIQTYEPDILLLDINMPGMNGLEVLRLLQTKNTMIKTIMLTMYDSFDYIDKCLEMGAVGYLAKSDAGAEVSKAIEAVINGEIYHSNSVKGKILDNYLSSARHKSQAGPSNIRLTKREQEVIRLVSEGMTSLEIADQLFLSPRTVETHRANLKKKLEVKNTVELLKKLEEYGLMDR